MTAPFAPLVLRRRSVLERRALAMLRGALPPVEEHEEVLASDVSRQIAKSQALFFAELRRVAARHGIMVQPADAHFVGDGELTLLSWIAQEQRITGQGRTIPVDPLLIAAVARCAGFLDALGVHLGPLTLYGARLRRRPSRDDQPDHASGRIAEHI